MNFNADDLINMWEFQDNIEGFAKDLLFKGIELGVLATQIEIHKASINNYGQPLADEDIANIAKIARKRAEDEMNERLRNARKPK